MHLAFVRSRLASFVAAAACLSLISTVSQAEAPLRWKFTPGESFDYQMTQDMNMNIDAGQAGQLATTAGQTMNMTWNVKSIDDQGHAVIEQKIDRIQMKMTAPGGQGFEYDTDSEEPAVGVAAMVAPTMEAMTAGQFTFTLSPRGEVSDVKVSEELLAAIKNGPGGEAGAVEQFKSMVSQVAFTLPEKPPDDWRNLDDGDCREESDRRRSDSRNDLRLRRHTRCRRHNLRRTQAQPKNATRQEPDDGNEDEGAEDRWRGVVRLEGRQAPFDLDRSEHRHGNGCSGPDNARHDRPEHRGHRVAIERRTRDREACDQTRGY